MSHWACLATVMGETSVRAHLLPHCTRLAHTTGRHDSLSVVVGHIHAAPSTEEVAQECRMVP